jgi:general secretion pathway protein G
MMRLCWIVTTTLLLAGCAADNTDAIKAAIKNTLPVAYKVEYGEFKKFPGGVVCGEFIPIGRFDVPEGARQFIYYGDDIEFVPSADDLAIFCSKDQEKQIAKLLNIGLPAKENQSLLAIYKDLKALDAALQLYISDNQIYPLTAQGLEALVSESETYPKPPRFRASGYIAKVPLDPWGRPYHYASEEKLRTEPIEYSLFTLGKDGKEGGTGDDADISSLHIKYLRHILED